MKKLRPLPVEVQSRLDSAAINEVTIKVASLADALAVTASAKSGSQSLRDLADTIRGLNCPHHDDGQRIADEREIPPGATLH